jgi:predicted dithiol-disulfide oxidoreductase (DUF899 family)
MDPRPQNADVLGKTTYQGARRVSAGAPRPQLFGRGGEDSMGIYRLFDMLPLGREEHGASHSLTDWAKLRNRYDDDRRAEASGAIATKS